MHMSEIERFLGELSANYKNLDRTLQNIAIKIDKLFIESSDLKEKINKVESSLNFKFWICFVISCLALVISSGEKAFILLRYLLIKF